MVKFTRLLLLFLFFTTSVAAENLADDKKEARKIAKRANKEAQAKASRQKSDPESMLNLLSYLKSVDGEQGNFDSGLGQNREENGEELQSNSKGNQVIIQDKQSEDSSAEPQPLSYDEAIALEKMKIRGAGKEATQPKKTRASDDSINAKNNLKDGVKIENVKNSNTSEVFSSQKIKESVYVPGAYDPSFSRNGGGSYGTVVRTNKEYGILFGTWVKARIDREVNSGDTGDVELILEEDLVGQFNSIPRGTIIYASKGFNAQIKRLAITTRRAVTPDKQVINKLSATAYDLNKRSGLDGYIERNREDVYKDVATDSLIELAASAASATLPTQFGDLTDSVEKLESSQTTAVPYTIRVQPQSFWLRIDQSL